MIPHICHFFYTGRIFENQILHQKKRLKALKTLKMSLKMSNICIFSLNLEKFTPDRDFLHRLRLWCLWQIWGMRTASGNVWKKNTFFEEQVIYIYILKVFSNLKASGKGGKMRKYLTKTFVNENIVFIKSVTKSDRHKTQHDRVTNYMRIFFG